MSRNPKPEADHPRLVSLRQVSGAGLANVGYLIIQSLLLVVMTPLVLKALGLEIYGLWMILAAVTGFANLANFGVGAGVTKYVSEFSVAETAGSKISAVVSFGFIFLLLAGMLIGVVIFLFRHPLAAKIVHQAGGVPPMAQALAIVSCGITIVFLTQLPKAVLFGLVYHKVVGAVDVAQSLFIQLAALIIGLRGGGIVPLALSILGLNLAFLVILAWIAFYVTRPFGLHFTLDRSLARQIFSYSSFAWISGLGSILFTQGDRILVGMMLGPAAAGAYGICTSVASRLLALASSATQVLVPFASSYQASGKHTEIAKVFLHLLRILGCLLAAAGLFLIIWGQWLLSIWISPEFSLFYGRVFVILILAYALFSMATPGYYIAFGLGRPGVPAGLNIGGALLMLICIALLSPKWGLLGAAIANLTYAIQILLNFYVGRFLGPRIYFPVLRSLGAPIFVLLVTLIMIQYLEINLLLSVSVNIISFAILIWLFFNKERLNYFLKAVKIN